MILGFFAQRPKKVHFIEVYLFKYLIHIYLRGHMTSSTACHFSQCAALLSHVTAEREVEVKIV